MNISIYLDLWCLTSALFSFNRKILQYLVRFTPKYFCLFLSCYTGIVFFISVSICSLLVYRNTIDHCILPHKWINLLVIGVVLVEFEIFCIGNHVSYNRVSSISFLLISMAFVSFPCLIALARNFSTMLSNSGKSRDPCNVPLSIMLVVGVFVDVLYQVVQISLSSYFSWMGIDFDKWSFCIELMLFFLGF